MAKQKEENTENLVVEEAKTSADNTQDFVEKNKSILTIVGIAIIILAGGIYFMKNSAAKADLESAENLWKAEYYMRIDSFQKAINSSGINYSLTDIANEYSGSAGGQIAEYDLGVSYLNSGKFNEAIEHFANVSFEDPFLNSLAVGCTGDAHLELNNQEEALSYYHKAADLGNNSLTSPHFLKKAGLIYMSKGDNAKALEVFNRIKNNYSESSIAKNEIDKYIARVQ